MKTKQDQLPLFKRKTFNTVVNHQMQEPSMPTGESSIMATLPIYMSYLQGKYASKTARMYFGDIKELSLYFKNKKLMEISALDIQDWKASLLSNEGRGLERKTVTRKLSAVINYFLWLVENEVLVSNPTETIRNTRIQSPLPDYLYEDECKKLYAIASSDPRIYLIVLLLLETGMKTNELFTLRKADIDTSDQFAPELWIKHKGKEMKKDRKLALPHQFVPAYNAYIEKYAPEDTLFPYTDRFIQMLFVELKKEAEIDKEVTLKTLRHTHVIRSLRRGEDMEKVFDRIGLAPYSRKEAGQMYSKSAGRGI